MTGKIRAYGLWEDARYMIISHTSFVMDKVETRYWFEGENKYEI